jgi:excisionase family DNA binding protein
MTERLVLSVAETAEVLGVSDDLVYELTETGQLPCLRFGRRKVIPRRAIDLVIERALERFDPEDVLRRLGIPGNDDAVEDGSPSLSTLERGNGHSPGSTARQSRRSDRSPSAQQLDLL